MFKNEGVQVEQMTQPAETLFFGLFFFLFVCVCPSVGSSIRATSSVIILMHVLMHPKRPSVFMKKVSRWGVEKLFSLLVVELNILISQKLFKGCQGMQNKKF